METEAGCGFRRVVGSVEILGNHFGLGIIDLPLKGSRNRLPTTVSW